MDDTNAEKKTVESLTGLVPFTTRSFSDVVKDHVKTKDRAARIKAEGTPRTDIDECLKKATTGREGLLVIGIDDQEGAAVIPAELLSLRRQGLENNAVLDGYVSVCRQILEYVLNACTYGETKVTEFSVRTEDESRRCSITLDWRSGQEWKLSYLFSGPDNTEGETE